VSTRQYGTKDFVRVLVFFHNFSVLYFNYACFVQQLVVV